MTNGTDHLRVVEAPQAPVDPLIGKTIDGRYEIENVLGQGGMGMVYQARHVILNKRLAIKVLKPEVSQNEEIMARFRQEAQSATSIGSQHIIDISDFLSSVITFFRDCLVVSASTYCRECHRAHAQAQGRDAAWRGRKRDGGERGRAAADGER